MCFYTGCKKLMQAHKYFACGSLVCMGMAIYSGHKIAPKKKKAEKPENKNTRPRRNKRGLFWTPGVHFISVINYTLPS